MLPKAGLSNGFDDYFHPELISQDLTPGRLAGIKVALRHVKNLYGTTKVREFGPLALETVRQRMIDAGNSRGYINDNVARVRRMFKWAAGLPRSRWLRRLGVKDQIVVWLKNPKSKPNWMTTKQFSSLPDEITVRELQYEVHQKGFRTREITLVTS